MQSAFLLPREVVEMSRLISCQYCGQIHDKGFKCGKKPIFNYDGKTAAFRNTKAWQHKREQIRMRDYNLCRLSLYYEKRIVCNDLSVHHIEPLSEAWEKRLENDNLITLSAAWHERAEAGEVSRELLRTLATSPPVLSF